MATTIGKWPVSPGTQMVEIPRATKLFCVSAEAGRLQVHGTYQPEAPLTDYCLAVLGEGEPLPPPKRFYIGSATIGGDTWHVYNCLPEE